MLRALTLVFLFLPLFSYSAIIVKVKGRKALVNLEGMEVSKGDKLQAINLSGSIKGLLKIRAVRRDQAVAVLVTGKMKKDWLVEPAGGSKKKNSFVSKKLKNLSKMDIAVSTKDIIGKSSSAGGMGLLAGGQFNIIPEEEPLSGLSWKGALLFDIPSFVEWFSIRTLIGYSLFHAEKKSEPAKALSIHYPGIKVLLRGILLQKPSFNLWIGLGGALFYPIVDPDKDLSLDSKSFAGLHGVASGALGSDIELGRIYIPIQIDMNWINPVMWLPLKISSGKGKEFKPLYIGFKAGLALHF